MCLIRRHNEFLCLIRIGRVFLDKVFLDIRLYDHDHIDALRLIRDLRQIEVMEWQRHINRKRGLAIQVCLAPMDFPQIIDLAFFMIITDMDTSLGSF